MACRGCLCCAGEDRLIQPTTKTVGVVLSGCGALDGTEIHEAFCSILALAKRGASIRYFAPQIQQCRLYNHYARTEETGNRDAFAESARFARGEITPLSEARADQLDAIMLPGGFGAARTLSDFSSQLEEGTVLPDLGRLLDAMFEARKPVAAICVATSLVAIALRNRGVRLAKIAMGDNPRFFGALQRMGHSPVLATATQVVFDSDHRLVTGPAFLAAGNLPDLEAGIDGVVEKLLEQVD